MSAVLEVANRPEFQDQTTFNLAVWEKILADPFYARLEHRIETNAHGQVLMSPPPHYNHGETQTDIALLLTQLMTGGRALTECPISTSRGVRAADTVWISYPRRQQCRHSSGVLTRAPEICVEVLSPSNTTNEMLEKKALYFEAGAEEVWFCSVEGEMAFYLATAPDQAARSLLCPD
ncbi:Uma2 family endonuclease, partial [Roseibacillus ishigakijimensis]